VAWLGLILLLLIFVVFAACWWGANQVFYPPAMTPLTVFPEQFDLRHEKVTFETEDAVTLKGWLIPSQRDTEKTIMFCHGWGDNKGDMLDRYRFLNAKFNLFFFDNRAHGDSQGKHSSIGYLESIDLDAALSFIKKHRPEWTSRIGLCGLSMGATVCIYGMANYDEFRCALLEAPFRSFNGVVEQFSTNHFALPYYPFVWLTLMIIRFRLGIDPESYSPRYHIKKIAKKPLLFIAGAEDRLMPPDRVRSLYEEAQGPKSLWVIPGATHGRCQEAAGVEYDRKVMSFFEAHL